MRAALAFVLGLLAVFAPSLEARRLLQSSGVTDADILNFALNLEVSVVCTAAVTAAVHLRFSPAAAAVSYLASQQELNIASLFCSVWRLSTTLALYLEHLCQMDSQATVPSLLVASKPTSPTTTFTALQWM